MPTAKATMVSLPLMTPTQTTKDGGRRWIGFVPSRCNPSSVVIVLDLLRKLFQIRPVAILQQCLMGLSVDGLALVIGELVALPCRHE